MDVIYQQEYGWHEIECSITQFSHNKTREISHCVSKKTLKALLA